MNVLGFDTVFGEELLQQLPVNYRFMAKIEASSFRENYTGRRFSRSARHQSQNYLCAAPGKPVSSLVVHEYLVPPADER